MNAANGMLLGFATARNMVANDSGEGSLYTNALLRHITTPGLSVTDMLTRVNAEVRKVSGGTQIPFMEVGLSDVFAFVPRGGAPAPVPRELSPARKPQLTFDGIWYGAVVEKNASGQQLGLPGTLQIASDRSTVTLRWGKSGSSYRFSATSDRSLTETGVRDGWEERIEVKLGADGNSVELTVQSAKNKLSKTIRGRFWREQPKELRGNCLYVNEPRLERIPALLNKICVGLKLGKIATSVLALKELSPTEHSFVHLSNRDGLRR